MRPISFFFLGCHFLSAAAASSTRIYGANVNTIKVFRAMKFQSNGLLRPSQSWPKSAAAKDQGVVPAAAAAKLPFTLTKEDSSAKVSGLPNMKFAPRTYHFSYNKFRYTLTRGWRRLIPQKFTPQQLSHFSWAKFRKLASQIIFSNPLLL